MALRLFGLAGQIVALTCEVHVMKAVGSASLAPPGRGRPRTPSATLPVEIRRPTRDTWLPACPFRPGRSVGLRRPVGPWQGEKYLPVGRLPRTVVPDIAGPVETEGREGGQGPPGHNPATKDERLKPQTREPI